MYRNTYVSNIRNILFLFDHCMKLFFDFLFSFDKVVSDGRFGGKSTSTILSLTNITCDGDEDSLLQCRHNKWISNGQCTSGNNTPAGVQCNGQ